MCDDSLSLTVYSNLKNCNEDYGYSRFLITTKIGCQFIFCSDGSSQKRHSTKIVSLTEAIM